MKKFTEKLSLQWRLTLIITLLMTVTCILLYFFISRSAVSGIENLSDYIIQIDQTDSSPIIRPRTRGPDLWIATTKRTQSLSWDG